MIQWLRASSFTVLNQPPLFPVTSKNVESGSASYYYVDSKRSSLAGRKREVRQRWPCSPDSSKTHAPLDDQRAALPSSPSCSGSTRPSPRRCRRLNRRQTGTALPRGGRRVRAGPFVARGGASEGRQAEERRDPSAALRPPEPGAHPGNVVGVAVGPKIDAAAGGVVMSA